LDDWLVDGNNELRLQREVENWLSALHAAPPKQSFNLRCDAKIGIEDTDVTNESPSFR
jgi:hypothetical protein